MMRQTNYNETKTTRSLFYLLKCFAGVVCWASAVTCSALSATPANHHHAADDPKSKGSPGRPTTAVHHKAVPSKVTHHKTIHQKTAPSKVTHHKTIHQKTAPSKTTHHKVAHHTHIQSTHKTSQGLAHHKSVRHSQHQAIHKSTPQVRKGLYHAPETYSLPSSRQVALEKSPSPVYHFLWFRWHGSPHYHSRLASRSTGYAYKTIDNLHYSAYKWGGNHFDPKNGIYIVDCSRYVDHLLRESSPQAYATLERWSGNYMPTTQQYYRFFNAIATKRNSTDWRLVMNTQRLQPGDILVFRYENKYGKTRAGHVMLVMQKKVVRPDVVQVRVADSASDGHSSDTRGNHSGIGIGTLLLKVNPRTGAPYAFAWRIGFRWNDHVKIAMGRPMEAA